MNKAAAEEEARARQKAPRQSLKKQLDETGQNDAAEPLTPVDFEIICDPSLLVYRQGLLELRKRGRDRYPRPSEVFSVIWNAVVVQDEDATLYKNMMSPENEWLSMAVERNKKCITVYLDPKGILFDSPHNRYVKGKDFTYKERTEFPMRGNPTWIELRQLDEDFVNYVYGSSVDRLEMIANLRAERTVRLPEYNTIWPVSRSRYCLELGGHFRAKARGVKVQASLQNQ
ncbi:hypothetical protein HY642_06550 [Candidatus Woesearchaeota archaeon]|nr:hypothetical protein [Candidatus Woesearchaeota archaeon]